MEWPKELLDIFDDPLLEGVRPKPKTPTLDDRLAMKLEEVSKWVEENGREPAMNGGLKEKLLCVSLNALRKQANDSLKQYDRLNLLG